MAYKMKNVSKNFLLKLILAHINAIYSITQFLAIYKRIRLWQVNRHPTCSVLKLLLPWNGDISVPCIFHRRHFKCPLQVLLSLQSSLQYVACLVQIDVFMCRNPNMCIYFCVCMWGWVADFEWLGVDLIFDIFFFLLPFCFPHHIVMHFFGERYSLTRHQGLKDS